uniref:Uncharacterized protein n=1 Tax=Tanacetum cinerariifolium TaxID=118510 RepID=A0A6L2MRG0_TANCI|nr:hypothetical protein [Tanacetum cinerariifolium]
MDQQYTTIAKIPVLDTGKFKQWQFQIQQYLQHEHYALWGVIEFGDSYVVPASPSSTTTTDTTSGESGMKSGRTVTLTAEDMQKKKNDVEARTTLLLSFPDEHQLRFSKYKTARELWAAILKTFGGNEATKKTNKNLLKQQYGNFKAEGSKLWSKRLINYKSDLDTMSLDDLYNHLKVYESEVQKKSKPNSQNMAFISSAKHSSGNEDGNTACVSPASTNVPTASASVATISQDTACAYIASQSSDKFWKKTGKKISIQGSDVAGFDKSRVECFNCHKMCHFARECRAPRSQERRRDNYRQGSKAKEQAPKAMMAIDGVGWDWSYMANAKEDHALVADEVAPTEFTLMANTSAESKTSKTESPKKPPVKYAERHRKPNKKPNVRGNQRNWNNLKSHQLGPDFVMKKKACLNCGDFNHLTYDCRKRVKKSFTPKPIVYRPYRPSQRPVRTNMNVKLHYRAPWVPTVNSSFPPVNRKFSTGSRNFPTANRKFPTGSTKCSTADMGMKGKAIKPSACWFWKPSQNLSNKGPNNNSVSVMFKKYTYIDTQGRLKHMTGNIFYLFDYELVDGGYVSLGQGGCKITGKGTIKTGKLKFKNVYFVKDLKDFKLLDDANIMLRTPRQHNMYSIDLNNIVPHRDLTCLVAKASADECMLWHRRLVNTACYVQNRVLVNKSHNKTPYELFNGRSPATGFLKPFGCHVMILNTLDSLRKFEEKKDEGYFIGYSMSSKAFRVFNKRTRRVEENLHVEFIENKTIKKGYGPHWLFDIDSLTKSINYVPVDPDTNSGNSHSVSSPVPTSYSTDCQEPSSDARLISKRVANQEETPSLENILSLTNQFKDILGVSSNSEESNGVEADISNIEKAIIASPTPTLRIHKDHPKSQIIGPVDTPIQTRNKSKEISNALQDPSWVEAVHEELLQFKIQNVWTSVDCPKGVRPIGIKWVLKNKKDERGIIIINKARIVAQGHTQEEGVDYDEVFAPVARIDANKLFLAYASFMGFTDPEFPTKVYKVEKAMYGLHQAPRAWYGTLSKYLLKNGFQMGIIDQTLFIRRQRGDFILVQVYVDDIIFRSSNPQLCREFEALMHEKFQMSAMDIMFAVCACARHQVTPKECHLYAVKRIFRYLKSHLKLGLWYPKESPFNLVAYSDSDYGGATQDCKSTTRGCQFLGRRLISWQCKKQTIVAISTTEAKYVAAVVDKFCGFRISCLIMDLLTKPFDAGRFQYLVLSMPCEALSKEFSSSILRVSPKTQFCSVFVVSQGFSFYHSLRLLRVYPIEDEDFIKRSRSTLREEGKLSSKDLQHVVSEQWQQEMDQQYPTVANIPVLDTGKFEQWQFRIQQYLQHEHYALWEVIEFGDSYSVPANSSSTMTTDTTSGETGTKTGRTVTLTAEDTQKKKNDVKARTTLLLSLPDEHQLRFSKYKTARELWAAILKTFGGNEATKKTKKNLPKWKLQSRRLRNFRTDIDEDDMEEMDIKWNMALLNMRADKFWNKTGKKISIQGSDVAGFDKSKVECFNCHKMGHFARECRAPRNQDRGRRDNYRQGFKAEEQAPKAVMVIDRVGWDWSYMANDEEDRALVADEVAPTEFALIANTSAKSKVFDNSLSSKDCKKNNDSLNKTLKEEKEGVDGKLAGLLKASKDLDNLIESQRFDKIKDGLGYNVVPPPPAQFYLSPKKDLSWTGLPECADDTVTDYSRPSPTVEKCIVLGRDFKLLDDANILLRTPRQHNMFSIDLNNIIPYRDLTCLVAKASTDECILWHMRLGHLNFKTINKLVRHNLVRGLPTKCFENDHTCTACLKGKQHKASCKSKLVNSVTKPLYTLHMDLFGPTIDETSGILKKFITKIEKLKDLKVKIIRCDNGGEFRNKEMNDFCLQKGIKREFSNARTPQQNGVAERRNRTLIEAARTMLADAKLPVTFWAEAVNIACYVQNRVLVNKSHNKTPYELFNGRSPAIGFLKPFGCHVMILNTLDNLGKFEEKRDEGYFIGYLMSSKAFRVFNKRTRMVEENLHVEFLENKAIKKGVGLNWLFDINSLTKSINYVPVDAGIISTNLSGTKDVASQEVKKNVSSLRYIALPNWAHDALLEFSLSKPQDHYSTKVLEDSKDPNPTASTSNPPADQIETLTVETPIPTVSSPVPSAYSIDSQDLSSDARLISKIVANQVETPSLDNILSLTNRFEDILGVTTNSDESNGVEADISNMETAITASPTPILKIHKDHPKSQIIGPMDTLIQTRNKSKETLVDCPKGVRPIGTKWVLENKKDERGIVIKNKARLVAQAHTQEEGIDYDEVFAPVARIKAIRLFLAYASFIGFIVYQMDMKSAFLYGTIDEEVYVMQPSGFQDPEFPAKVYKVEKAIQGESLGKVRTGNDVDLYLYRSMIRSLMYLTASRPDIMFAVCACARHQVTPKECHLHATIVATSTTEAEYVTAASCCGQVLWIHNQLLDYRLSMPCEALSREFSTSIHLLLHFCDYHNMVAILEKGEHNIDFHPIVDFIKASPLRIKTTKEGTQILATVDGIHRTVTELSLRRNIKLKDKEGISSLPDTNLFENLTLMGYNISPNQKFTFQKDEPAYPQRDVSQRKACPTDSGFIADQDRATIDKSFTLPHDSAPRVTSPVTDEGTQEVEINRLKERVKMLEDKEGVNATRSEDDAPIKGRSMDEGEAATKRISDDSEEMATVLTFMDAATVLASGVVDVPTGSGSIPIASTPAKEQVPTGSDVVPTASLVFATATVVTPYRRRKGKEVMVESKTPKKQKVQ